MTRNTAGPPATPAEVRTFLRRERRMGGAVSLLLMGAALFLALTAPAAGRNPRFVSLGAYAALAVPLVLLSGARWLIPSIGHGLVLTRIVVDLLFATWLVYLDGAVGSNLVLLYPILVLRSALVYPQVPQALPLAFLFAPLYAGALFVDARSLYFLGSEEYLIQNALLLALTLLGVHVAGEWRARQERVRTLEETIRTQDADLDRKTSVLQRTASNLSERVVELRSIQEGFKAISSALALDDVLRLIVENASRVLNESSCYLALMGQAGERPTLATVALPAGRELAPSVSAQLERVAGWIVSEGRPFNTVVADRGTPPDVGMTLSSSLIGAPLFVDDRPIGALMSTSTDNRPFEPDQISLLAAFADQAALAVKNARLYRDLSVEKRRSEEKTSELEAILQGIGDGVIVTDRNGNLLMINPRAAQIFGLSRLPELGAPLLEIVRNTDLHSLLKEVQETPAQVAMQEIVLPPNRDRQPVYQGLAASVLNADGRVSGIVTVLRDITGQKELERMKSNFLSVISHELRTPLHSIKGFVDIILMGKTGEINDIQRDFLGTVKEQTTQLQRLISDLLEFSRLESGEIKLQPRELSPTTLVNEVIDKLSPLAVEGGVRLHSTLPADLPSIEADPVRLEQVFSNLVDNAIKFTPAGGQVTIGGRVHGEHIRLRVTDTGVGIPEDERERVFDRFYQVQSGSTRAYRGTGLGLTICKHIVERHHGRIWIEDSEGSGAVFVVELPRELPLERELALDFSNLPSRNQPPPSSPA